MLKNWSQCFMFAGTRIEVDPKYQHYPATLYSTVGSNGQVGGLSTQFPQQGHGHGRTVPVIILRVFADQIGQPHNAIYPALPQTHPYSNQLNRINLQQLVTNYLQQHLQQNYVQPEYGAPSYQQPAPQYQQPVQYEQPQAQYRPVSWFWAQNIIFKSLRINNSSLIKYLFCF